MYVVSSDCITAVAAVAAAVGTSGGISFYHPRVLLTPNKN